MMKRFFAIGAICLLALTACGDEHTAYQKKIQEYSTQLLENPDDVEAHYLLGVTYLTAGNWKAGADHLKDSVRLDKNHTRAYRDLGWALYQLKDYENAERALSSSYSLNPLDPRTANLTGVVKMTLGRPHEAAQVLSTALSNGIDTLQIRNNLATVYRTLGQNTRAMELLQETKNQFPKSPEVHNNLGVMYEALKMDEEAFQEFNTALELDPGIASTHYNIGAAFSRAGNSLMALGHMHKARLLDPENPKILRGVGKAYWDLKKYEEAIPPYEESLHRDPSSPEAHFALAQLYGITRQTEKAMESYEMVINLNPDEVDVYYNLSLLHDDLNHGEKALVYMAIAEQLYTQQANPTRAQQSRHNVEVFQRKYQFSKEELKELLRVREI